MKPTQPWSMARVASRRELPKPRKMHGPVGSEPQGCLLVSAVDADGETFVVACKACGHDVCSCKPVDHLAKLKAAVLKHPDWEIVPHKYLRRGDVVQAYGRTCANPADVKAFTDELERAGVPCRVASFDTRPGSVDVAGLEALRAEWQKDREF